MCSPEGKCIPRRLEQEFFKACNYRAELGGKRAAPTQAGWQPSTTQHGPVQPVGTAACAEHLLPSVPRGPGCFLCNSATAKHPTEQETRGFGWFGLAWHPGLVHNGHFPPPPSFLSSVKFPPGCTPTVLRIQMPRQLEKLPKARRGKPHNPSPVPPVWPCLCKAGSRL